jgi:hypothetical protein
VDEVRKLGDAYDQGLTMRATAALFPTKTYNGVATQYQIVTTKLSARDKRRNLQGEPGVKWPTADIELLQKLYAEGASVFKMCAHFPTRSVQSVMEARKVYATKTFASQKTRAPWRWWSQEDSQYLVESVLQGASIHHVAKVLGRTSKTVVEKAHRLGVQFRPRANLWSTEEERQLLQMRSDGASFETIGAALGRTFRSVEAFYYRHATVTSRDSKPRQRRRSPPTQLTLDDYQSIQSLRDKGTPWSSIGSLFPQYGLSSIQQDFWRFTKSRLSATDVREIERLRGEGTSWKGIVGSGDYPLRTAHGLTVAYRRAREDGQ